jgi:hypothetical protein
MVARTKPGECILPTTTSVVTSTREQKEVSRIDTGLGVTAIPMEVTTSAGKGGVVARPPLPPAGGVDVVVQCLRRTELDGPHDCRVPLQGADIGEAERSSALQSSPSPIGARISTVGSQPA